jgi:O-antigen/teichoic acid export membrane protein
MSLSSKSFSIFQRDLFLLLCNLITGIVIARKLGPELMGLWAILQLIPGYAEAFGRLKFDVAAIYMFYG